VCLKPFNDKFFTKGDPSNVPCMLKNWPTLRAAPLILVNLVTNRLTFDSVNINEPLFCEDSSLDTDLRTISEAAPYPSEAARPVKISGLWCKDRAWKWLTSVMEQSTDPGRRDFG